MTWRRADLGDGDGSEQEMKSCIKEDIYFGSSELSSTSNHHHLISAAFPTAFPTATVTYLL